MTRRFTIKQTLSHWERADVFYHPNGTGEREWDLNTATKTRGPLAGGSEWPKRGSAVWWGGNGRGKRTRRIAPARRLRDWQTCGGRGSLPQQPRGPLHGRGSPWQTIGERVCLQRDHGNVCFHRVGQVRALTEQEPCQPTLAQRLLALNSRPVNELSCQRRKNRGTGTTVRICKKDRARVKSALRYCKRRVGQSRHPASMSSAQLMISFPISFHAT
jgi:hypothetical protein